MTQGDQFRDSIHQAVDYVSDLLGESVSTAAATIISCLQLGSRVITCATYGSITPCEYFVQELNKIFIQRTGGISVYSLNSDSRNLGLLRQGDPGNIFSAQFDLVGSPEDLLLLVPGSFPGQQDPSETAILRLMEKAREKQCMIICISCSSRDSFITERLGPGDLTISLGDLTDPDTAVLALMYVFQIMLKSGRQG